MSIIDFGLVKYVRSNMPLDVFLIGQHHGLCVHFIVTDIVVAKYFNDSFDAVSFAASLDDHLGLPADSTEIERGDSPQVIATRFVIPTTTNEDTAEVTAALCSYLQQRFPDGFDATIY